MLENPAVLPRLVKETGAKSTNLESPETADELCAKTVEYAKEWAPVANEIWETKKHANPEYVSNDAK